MQYTSVMGIHDGIANLTETVDESSQVTIGRLSGPLLRHGVEILPEGLAGDEAHRIEEVPVLVLTQIIHRYDVGMLEASCDACLRLDQSPAVLVPASVLSESLQRDFATRVLLSDDHHSPEATLPQSTHERVPGGKVQHGGGGLDNGAPGRSNTLLLRRVEPPALTATKPSAEPLSETQRRDLHRLPSCTDPSEH